MPSIVIPFSVSANSDCAAATHVYRRAPDVILSEPEMTGVRRLLLPSESRLWSGQVSCLYISYTAAKHAGEPSTMHQSELSFSRVHITLHPPYTVSVRNLALHIFLHEGKISHEYVLLQSSSIILNTCLLLKTRFAAQSRASHD